MPFTPHRAYSYTDISIRQNAPSWGGIYGLSNAQNWIYIDAVDDIRSALLEHLSERNPTPDFRSVTGFAFELCDSRERSQRFSRLVEELHPRVRVRTAGDSRKNRLA